jgi:iron-sulfur cluster assembly protein
MIQLSLAALREVLRLRSSSSDSPNSDLKLRIEVVKGGCLDWSYTLRWDSDSTHHDQVYQCDEIAIVTNEFSHPYLKGLIVDYAEDLMGGGFRFTNPNASQSCNCGNSFVLL